MLPWKSIITFDSLSKRAQYLQLADSLIQEVIQGRIAAGLQLPGTRQMAEALGVNRKTVQSAYDELLAQGWTEIIPYKGTFIKEELPLTKAQPLSQEAIFSTPKLEVQKNKAHQITEGTPDYRVAPIPDLYKAARSLASGRLSQSVLTGNHFSGETHLRTTLCSYLHETRALSPIPDQIIVTRGSQMAIFLALSAIMSPGDKVIVGRLNYDTANRTIKHLGGELVQVSLNEKGLDVIEIEKILATKKIKAIYLSPHHHYPTTVTMPVAERLRLLELARKHDFYILEDDYDYDYHYKGSPILPMASLDQGKQVIYIGSFSKILAPSIRMGYMYADQKIIEKCILTRQLIDRRGDPLLERALAMMIEEKEIQRSIKKAVKTYHMRRDLMHTLLQAHFRDSIQYELPDGGMAIWVDFRDIEIKNLIDEAKQQELYLDIDTYEERNKCRLGFASMNEKEMETNLRILKQVVELLRTKK